MSPPTDTRERILRAAAERPATRACGVVPLVFFMAATAVKVTA